MNAKPRLQKWLRRAHKYLELARTRGIPVAEEYGKQFKRDLLDQAIELISSGMAKPRT